MTATPVHGKLSKQGPLATLGSFTHGEEDRFIFNGQQFVSLSAQSPKVVLASARKTIGFENENDILYMGYNNFMDSEGTFRLVDGSPMLEQEIYTGWPGVYDHVVIGYDNEVSTSTIKFWTKNYINPDTITIDYGDTDNYYFSISGISVNYEFDDSIRHTYTEIIPSGMYVYTVTLGATYTGKYWRIKAFLTGIVKSTVSGDINGGTLNITDTTSWPSSGDVYLFTKPGATSLVESRTTSFTGSSYNPSADSSYIYGLRYIYPSSTAPKSSYVLVEETFFNPTTNETVTEGLGYAYMGYDPSIDLRWVPATYTVYAHGRVPDGITHGDVGPHGGVVSATLVLYLSDTVVASASYASKTGTSLQTITSTEYGVTGDDLPAGTIVQTAQSMDLAQVRIKEETVPLLRFWETDGHVSKTLEVDISNAYDVVYDRSDEVYYAAVFNTTGGSGPDMSDDFSGGDSSDEFNSNRWTNIGGAVRRDDVSDCLVFDNSVSGTITYGNLITNYYHNNTQDFVNALDAKITTLSGSVGYYGLVVKDKDTNNHLNGVYALGEWAPIGSAQVAGVEMYSVINGSSGDAELRNFRFDPRNLPEDEVVHKFLYESSTWKYSRTSQSVIPVEPDIVEEDVGDNTYISRDGFSVSLDKNPDITNGSYISFYTNKTVKTGLAQSDVELRLEYTSTSSYLKSVVNDGSDSYLTNSYTTASRLNTEVVGYTDNFTTVSSTGFNVTGNYAIDMPCLTVKAFDNDGHITSVPSVTDANGISLAYFDVLRQHSTVYGDNYNRVSIATTGDSVSLGGSIFIRVGSDLYKYDKTTMPLSSVEDGSNASVLASGVVPETDIYNFAFDGYTNGGLSYVHYDSGRSGVFLQEVRDSTLQLTSYETELDLSVATVPLAWDVRDMDVLYVIDSSNVYAFNTDENSVAFTNISVGDNVLPANANAQTSVTAHVINLFGDALSNKRVYFSITAGGGSVTPASACTTSSGTASITFTAGTVSGTSVITATASNDTC